MTENEKTVIEIRAKSREALARWWDEKVVQPFLSKCKEEGLTKKETVDLFNEIVRHEFRGLHGFPAKQRRKPL